MSEKDSLGQKVREYAQSLLQYEEALALKDQEKAELLGSYEDMKREAEEMAVTLRELQGNLTKTKTDVLAASKVSRCCRDSRCSLHRDVGGA